MAIDTRNKLAARIASALIDKLLIHILQGS